MRARTVRAGAAAVATALGVLLALPACGEVRGSGADPGAGRAGTDLPAFDDCTEFETRMRDLAAARIGPEGARIGENHTARRLLATDRAGSLADGGSGTPVGSALVTTAVLGEHLATLRGGALRIVDAHGPDPRVVATVSLPGLGDAGILGLVAIEDRLLVVGDTDPKVFAGGSSGGYVPPERRPKPDSTLDLTLIDLAEPASPRVVASATISGRAIEVVRTGEVIRLALTTDVEMRLPAAPTPEATRQVVRSAGAEDWLPEHEIRDSAGNLVASGPLLDCTAVRYPRADSGLDLISILTIYPQREDPFSVAPAVGVLASGDQVAGSGERLFVLTSAGWNLEDGRSGGTAVHAFDLTQPGPPRLLGSEPLPGYLPDPRALSVRGTMLRAVTTDVEPWTRRQRVDHALGVATYESGEDAVVSRGARTGLGNGHGLKVLRWLDDVVVLAPDSTAQAHRFPNENAAPMRVISLGGRGELPLRTILEPPQRTAEFLPLGQGRLLGIGQRAQADQTRGRLDLEVFEVDLRSGEPAGFGEVVSFGQGEEQGRFFWLPQRRTVLIPGWSTVGSDCAAGTECATTPRPACAGPCSFDPSDEFNGLMGVRLIDDGTLRRAVWLASDLNPVEVVPVGDRIAVVGTSGLFILDAELNPAGSVEYPQPRRVTRENRYLRGSILPSR